MRNGAKRAANTDALSASDNDDDDDRGLALLLPAAAPDIAHEPLPPGYVRRRTVFVAVAFLGTTVVYLTRSNLGVAIIPMAEQFSWSKTTQGQLLSSYYYGYVAAQVVGGPLAVAVGGRRVVAGCALVAAALGALTPLAATAGPGAVTAVRATMGLVEGAIYPSIHALIAAWAPPGERSAACATIYAGNYAGTALALGLTGAQLASAGAPAWAWARLAGGDQGWAAVFYVHAGAALAWVCLWWCTVYDGPGAHPHIHPAEVAEIVGAAAAAPPPPPSLDALRAVPWRGLLSSPPFWAVVVNHFTTNFSTYVLSSWIPTFVKDALGQPIDAAGALAVLPYVAALVIALAGGVAADRVIASRALSTTAVRKLWQCTSQAVTAAALVGVSFVSAPAAAVTLLVAAVGASGLTESGYHGNHIDIAPRCAGVAFAITNFVGNCGGIVGPQLVGALLDPGPGAAAGANPTSAQWREMFVLTAGANVFGGIVWATLASGEKQV